MPLLVEGASWIADPQVRYKGTIGGDISHGDPGNDHPALMLALDASFVLKGPRGERVVKADGYFLGLYSTLLEPGEILTQIRVPIPAAGCGSARIGVWPASIRRLARSGPTTSTTVSRATSSTPAPQSQPTTVACSSAG